MCFQGFYMLNLNSIQSTYLNIIWAIQSQFFTRGHNIFLVKWPKWASVIWLSSDTGWIFAYFVQKSNTSGYQIKDKTWACYPLKGFTAIFVLCYNNFLFILLRRPTLYYLYSSRLQYQVAHLQRTLLSLSDKTKLSIFRTLIY